MKLCIFFYRSCYLLIKKILTLFCYLEIFFLSRHYFVIRITESQCHIMVGVGWDLWGSSSPTLLTKQGHLKQVSQDCVQAGFEYLQRRRLHNLSGQPVPVLCHSQSEEDLPHVQMELPMVQFVPLALIHVTGHY